jgi:hypothetical protein
MLLAHTQGKTASAKLPPKYVGLYPIRAKKSPIKYQLNIVGGKQGNIFNIKYLKNRYGWDKNSKVLLQISNFKEQDQLGKNLNF